MGMFFNNKVPYTDYSGIVSEVYFVEKSDLIAEFLPAIGKKNRYFCITRPRRFGKSVMVSRMSESCDSYRVYISCIQTGLKEELAQGYSSLALSSSKAVEDILQLIFEKTGERFIL
ncbi:MAG: AAA family ATPase [Dorea sp.]|nr:AAA family ATPase [Dorea sp.]